MNNVLYVAFIRRESVAIQESLLKVLVVFIKSMLMNKNNLEFLSENFMLRSKFEDGSVDDIFI